MKYYGNLFLKSEFNILDNNPKCLIVYFLNVFQKFPKMSIPNLDEALNELGMLSTVTNSRKEYLYEQLKKCNPNNYSLDRFLVTSQYSKELNGKYKKQSIHSRYMPYYTIFNNQLLKRNRTKSESSDIEVPNDKCSDSVPCLSDGDKTLKKSKSMENILNKETENIIKIKPTQNQELDNVSRKIRELQMQ